MRWAPVAAVAAALALGALLLLWIGESPVEVAKVLLAGAFGTSDGIGAVLFGATTLVFTGLSVAFAFRAGLFNIGAEGQLVMGAFLATMTALVCEGLPAIALLPLSVLAAAIGGAFWGVIPGLLRAKFGVHEVINTIMMNFIASGLTGYLTVHVFREPGQMIPQTSAIPEAARVPRLGELVGLEAWIPASSPANSSLFLALAVCGLLAWTLHRTPFGFRVRALGLGSKAARTAGMPTGRTLVQTMAVAGAIAGLAGVNEVLGFRYRFLDNFSSGVGFLGLAVALIGGARVAGVIAAALLFGALSAGAVEVDLFTQVPREIVLIVEAGILLFVVTSEDFFHRARRAVRAGRGRFARARIDAGRRLGS